MENPIDKALQIACQAHAGQVDKAGQPYILHPIRLALNFKHETLQIIALLHDVVEDSDVSLQHLSEIGFDEEIIKAIDALTKRDDEKYEDFIDRVSKNSLATQVKLSDLKDNMDVTRLKHLNEKDFERLQRYQKAYAFLSESN